MATGLNNAHVAAWTSALSNLRTLQNADLPRSCGSEYPGSSDATDLLAAAEAAILDLPAPTLSAVIQKLDLLWEFELEGDCENARHRQMVMGDLQRLAFLQS